MQHKSLNWLELLEQEPDAGLGNGGLGRLAACFIESAATMHLPAMGYGLAVRVRHLQTVHPGRLATRTAGQLAPTPGPLGSGPSERTSGNRAATVPLNFAAEACARYPAGRPALIGIPFDRPVVGYGGKTINTLRLWAAAAPDYFDFQEFSGGDFVGALAETLSADSLTRVLYPDDSTSMGQGLRFVQEYFLVACSLADLVRRFRRGNSDWSHVSRKSSHPTE